MTTGTVVARNPSKNWVVDASVAVKWVLPEDHSEAAQRLLESGNLLAAPAHWLAEALNAVGAACLRREITEQEAHERSLALADAPIATVSLHQLAAAAMVIGLRLGITIYDALYLALAERDDATLITDDRRLIQAVRHDKQMRGRVRSIADN